jgi:hypothetical protein
MSSRQPSSVAAVHVDIEPERSSSAAIKVLFESVMYHPSFRQAKATTKSGGDAPGSF